MRPEGAIGLVKPTSPAGARFPLRPGHATHSAGDNATGLGDAWYGMVAFLASSADDGGGKAVHEAGRPARSRRLPRTVRVLADNGTVVCTHCEVAESAISRMRGLLGRSGLGAGEGMLINAAPSVMTFFMRFPIDVVFIDRAQTIVKIAHSLVPWRTAGARGAVAALELPPGTAAALALEPGMTLVLADDATTQ